MLLTDQLLLDASRHMHTLSCTEVNAVGAESLTEAVSCRHAAYTHACEAHYTFDGARHTSAPARDSSTTLRLPQFWCPGYHSLSHSI
jgi:hypothetical protein